MSNHLRPATLPAAPPPLPPARTTRPLPSDPEAPSAPWMEEPTPRPPSAPYAPSEALPAPAEVPSELRGTGAPSDGPQAPGGMRTGPDESTPRERLARVIRDGMIYLLAIGAVWHLQHTGRLDIGSGTLIGLLAGVRAQGLYDVLASRLPGAARRASGIVGTIGAGAVGAGVLREVFRG